MFYEYFNSSDQYLNLGISSLSRIGIVPNQDQEILNSSNRINRINRMQELRWFSSECILTNKF